MKKIKYIVIISVLMLFLTLCGCEMFHEYDNPTVHYPTCNSEGYTIFTCKKCGDSYKTDITPKTSHSIKVTIPENNATCSSTGNTAELVCSQCNMVLQKSEIIPISTEHKNLKQPVVYAPTCTVDGYTFFECLDCGSTYVDNIVPALGHSTKVTKEAKAPTCSSSGYTEELSCTVCNEVVQNASIIPETGIHVPIITKPSVAPTCNVTGLSEEIHCEVCDIIIQKQEILDALHHTDSNTNSLCDNCGIPYGNDIIFISNVEELKRIDSNPSGVYQLTADIDLSGEPWIALCSKNAPFSGYLYGNNFSIKGLSISDTSGALFSYVTGTIDGIKIENLKFSSKNCSVNIGGVAIYNLGTIKNCILSGNNTITQSVSRTQSTKWPSYDGSKVSYKNIFGGLCAVNEGTISNCKVVKSFNSSFTNKNYFKLAPAFPPPVTGEMYKSTCESTIYFGAICGENKGKINDCTVSHGDSNLINIVADYDKYGSSYAITNAYIGSLVGVNSKTVTNCSAKASAVIKELGSDSSSGSNGGQHPKLNLYMDNKYRGIIGKNGGTVENTLYNSN